MKKVFLSHKEKHPQLHHFVAVLRELIQIEPVLLEECPTIGGMPPGRRAEYYMKQCEGILFLLTKDIPTGERWHPSQSVSMEITLAEKLFSPDMRFYMLEQGVTFPSMAEKPSYIDFLWEEIMPALVNLRKTFKSAELIETTKTVEWKTSAPLEPTLFLLDAIANNTDGIQPDELSALYQKSSTEIT